MIKCCREKATKVRVKLGTTDGWPRTIKMAEGSGKRKILGDFHRNKNSKHSNKRTSVKGGTND